jgi:hypothetical protein
MSGADLDDFSAAGTPPAPPVPPAFPPPLPSPPPLIDVKVVRVPIKTLLLLAVLVVGVLVTIHLVHTGNHALASGQSAGAIAPEKPGVLDLRSALSQITDDLGPIAADGSTGNFDALPAECRTLAADVQAARGQMTADMTADARTHVRSALTLFDQGTRSCASRDYGAAAQSFNQGVTELTEATLALNR